MLQLTRRESVALGLAFAVTFVATALGAYWNQLEPRYEFPLGTKVMLAVAVLAAAAARFAGRTRVVRTIVVVASALPVGSFLVLVIELIRDPTSNNLWPIGLFLMAVLGLIVASIGVALGSFILWIAPPTPPATPPA